MDTEKLENGIHEIRKEGEMNTPARIYASDTLLEKMRDDNTLEQVQNMARLPTIEKYSIVLPDGHQGYGFPIGGVAAFDSSKGIISPGGIGFDINCLSGDTEVTLEFGRKKQIEDLKNKFSDEKAVVTDKRAVKSDIQLFTEKESKEVFNIKTETGEKIKATAEHPFLTKNGMKKVEDIQEGEQVVIRPFEGLEDEEPEEFNILGREDFKDENPQLLAALEERDLLPLKSTDRELNILLKLVGFHTGDGSFNNHSETTFYAEKEDLKKIQKDIRSLGFKPSQIYSRDRKHSFKGNRFERTEYSVKSTSKAFQKLMIKLGAPKGEKTQQAFTTPDYLPKLTTWQKALYMSAFFGAEMSAPSAQSRKNLYCPKISQNKSKKHEESCHQFMKEMKQYLSEAGIKTNSIESFDVEENQKGKVTRVRLGIKNNSENLINFFTKIGYRYNLEKQKKAVKVTQYLKKKQKAIEERENIAKKSIELYESGERPKGIKQKFDINNRFIERSIYSGRKTVSRPPNSFPDYEEYAEDMEVKDNLSIATSVKSIEKAGKEDVYDIGVEHEAHNFIANHFVVSNCGVRVLKTDLGYEEVMENRERLANMLFGKIPCGLGGGGYIDTDKQDLKEILDRGMEWMLENGHAEPEDMERCEENGKLPGDHRKVPEKAIERGKSQVGSLGSGNHFLEIQKVEEVFNPEKASAYGLKEGQVIVMIHSGSRGLGHETCSQYLRKFEKEYPDIAESLPEKNLMYAPLEDRLAEDYKKAMYAAANFAWANRQAMTQGVRDVLEQMFGDVETELLYDVCHNIAKEEEHTVNGEKKELLVHRKGATRAFPAGRPEIPEVYREAGQPVLIPGTMGTSSYIMSGGENSLELTFGSAAHGAGRLKSRTQAKKDHDAKRLKRDLETEEEVHVRARSDETISEEAPDAYKDVDEVIEVTDRLGLAEKVARSIPILNIKG